MKIPTILSELELNTGGAIPQQDQISGIGDSVHLSSPPPFNPGLAQPVYMPTTNPINDALVGTGGKIAETGMSAMQLAKRRELTNQALEIEKIESDTKVNWLKWMDQNQPTAQGDLTAKFSAEYDKYVAKTLENTPENMQEPLKLALSKFGVEMLNHTLSTDARYRVQANISTVNGLVQNASDIIAATNNPKDLDEQQKKLRITVDEMEKVGSLPKDVADNFRESINNLSAQTAEHLAATNPIAARKIIEEAIGIDMSHRTAILDKIDRAMTTHSNLFEYEQKQALESNISQIEQIGYPSKSFDMDTYKSIMGEANAKAAEDSIKIAQQFYEGKSSMEGVSENEIMTNLAKYKPNPDDPAFADKQKVFAQLSTYAGQQVKLLHEDPFVYSMQDPVVQRAWTMFDNVKDADRSIRGPAMLNAIAVSMNVQQSLGIPEGERSVMPKSQAVNIAAAINHAAPDQVENEFISLMSSYGQFYPDVFRDISRLPNDQRIDSSMSIVALHIGKPWLKEFVEAARIPMGDYKLDDKSYMDLKVRVGDNPTLNNFKAAITSADPSRARLDYANGFNEAVMKFALSLQTRGKADSIGDAVKMSTDMLINSEYGFGESGSERFAVKRTQTGIDGKTIRYTDDDIRKIEVGLDVILDRTSRLTKAFDPVRLKPEAIDEGQFYFDDTVLPDERRKGIQNVIRNNSFWVTNPDNTGVTLYMPGYGGTAAPIKTKDGKPISIGFGDVISKVYGKYYE